MKTAELTDSHCHIHSRDYKLRGDLAYRNALDAGVSRMVCIGTDSADSRQAVEFATAHKHCWASIGLHPHDAKLGKPAIDELRKLAKKPKVVAVGECGLDYHYNYSPKSDQILALKWQIKLALEHNLALVFHVREAFEDFWPVIDEYRDIRGVVHSFTGTKNELEQILKRNLYVGVNGIATFTKDLKQLEAYKQIPLKSLVLETDAPYLTPNPYRGKVNESRYVELTARYLADLRGEDLATLKTATTQNAKKLYLIP